MIITTIDQVREVVGVSIRKEGTFEVLKPYLESAQQNLLAGLIGAPMLTKIKAEPVGSALAQLTRSAIVWNGYLSAWYHTFYQLGNAGINRQTPKDTKDLFRYQEDAIQKDIVRKADEAIERLMEYLEANASTLSEWTSSDAYKASFSYLIHGPARLHQSLPEVSKSYRMYDVLRGYMERVERATVEVITGPALFATLKAKRKTNAPLDDHYARLYNLACDYAAPATLLEAMPWIRVQFSVTGIRILSTVYNLQDETPVNDAQAQYLQGLLKDRCDTVRADLRSFLNQTASATVFPEYYQSGLYRRPGSRQWKSPNNEGKKHFRL
jgi:hypothetical protein